MADIFGYKKEITTGVSAASAVQVSIGGGGDLRLAQSVNVTYQRQVQPVYEIGSENVYMTAGRASGTCNFDHLVGKTAFLKPFKPGSMEEGCKGTTITLQSSKSSCGAAGGSVTMTNCVLQQVGLQVTSQDITVHDTAVYTIGSLEAG